MIAQLTPPATSATSLHPPVPELHSLLPVSPRDHEITQLLQRAGRGELAAREALLSCVFEELHSLACVHMRGQPKHHTLQPTALIHETYLRLFRNGPPDAQDRHEFFRIASQAMRTVLVDHARSKLRSKRNGDRIAIPLEQLTSSYEERAHDLVALDEALQRLAGLDPRLVSIIELTFFGGRSQAEAADILGVSLRTVERDWHMARAWLRRELE